MAARRSGEFELIARYFAPLAKGFAGARGLESDNAFLAADPLHDDISGTPVKILSLGVAYADLEHQCGDLPLL